MEQEYTTIAIHLLGALIAGGLIGSERSFHGRPAGFRTHTLVCVTSSLLMLVTVYQWQWLPGVPLETVKTDPTRMAQGIMTGIGFLGAGVIYKEGATVRGLTTAASIWLTAAIGSCLALASIFLPSWPRRWRWVFSPRFGGSKPGCLRRCTPTITFGSIGTTRCRRRSSEDCSHSTAFPSRTWRIASSMTDSFSSTAW